LADTEALAYDDIWRRVLAGTQWHMRVGRRLMRHLPTEPRCKLCAAPFGGLGSVLMRLVGKGPWPRNPKYCSQCFKQLTDHHGGAEIGCSLLFADVRGSTAMAQDMRPSDVHDLMERFSIRPRACSSSTMRSWIDSSVTRPSASSSRR